MIEEMPPLRSLGYVDPGWEHGIAQDERKKKVKCNYCGKVVSGGIYRLKQHLARVSREVRHCYRAPEEVYLKMRENLEGFHSTNKPMLTGHEDGAYSNSCSHDVMNKTMRKAGFKRKGHGAISNQSLVMNCSPLSSQGYVDPGWEYGVAQDERKKKVKCNYCGKVVSGGINRFKQHLARIPGEVAPCKNAPDDVYLKMKENMKWHRSGKRPQRPDGLETPVLYGNSSNETEADEQDDDGADSTRQEKLIIGDKRLGKGVKKDFSGRISSESGSDLHLTKLRSVSDVMKTSMNSKYRQSRVPSSRKNRKEVIAAICEFFYYAGVPLHTADSVYFQKMFDLVGQYGGGLVAPSSRHISGRFLQEEVGSIKNNLLEYRASWMLTGCSIMADSWKDKQGQTRINFLVSCPQGVHFISTVDATDVIDNATNLFMLLDKVVDEVGEENVVQVVTQNTPCYEIAGKMLEEKRRNLFWTPCAIYCIDKMLEELIEIKVVAECIEKGQRITRFIYNRLWLLKLMKKEFTGGQDLLRPAITRSVASFAALQKLIAQRSGLKRLFSSNKWLSSRFSKSDEGKEVEKIVLSDAFWKKMRFIWRTVEPIVLVLKKAESTGSSAMPYIYNDIHRAKHAIKSINGNDVRKYGPFWIDNHSSSMCHHPLYLAAYFLNPAYRYRADYIMNPEMMRGLNECIIRLEPDGGKRISASMQVADFMSAKADFGTELAINTRSELDPAAWWQQHGMNCLELQWIAVRILSQTCSSFGSEHNWSSFDQISSVKVNRVAQRKAEDLAYAHNNLRLSEQERWNFNGSTALDTVPMDGLLDDWLLETENQPLEDDEELLDSEDEYEYGMIEYDDCRTDAQRGSLEMVTLADVEPLALDADGISDAAPDDDNELEFLDEVASD
ncbi:hypothetical protein AKJ16_DCAP12653 [Drosera capensis]